MRKIFGRANVWTMLSVALIGLLTAVLFTVWAAKPEKYKPKADILYEFHIENQFRDLEEICDAYTAHQENWIEIVPPRMTCLNQPEGVRVFNYRHFPRDFVKGLVPVEKNGITYYPITIFEDGNTRDHVFLNANGSEIYSVPPPEGYNPDWLLLMKTVYILELRILILKLKM